MRDDLLATTAAGRRWIALFERVQLPLVGVVLGDERLSEEAAALVERAGRLVREEKATVTDEDVERGLSLILDPGRAVGVRGRQSILEAIDAEVSGLAGLTAGDVMERLMRPGPANRSQK